MSIIVIWLLDFHEMNLAYAVTSCRSVLSERNELGILKRTDPSIFLTTQHPCEGSTSIRKLKFGENMQYSWKMSSSQNPNGKRGMRCESAENSFPFLLIYAKG